MNLEQKPENDLNNEGIQLPAESQPSALEKEKSVEDYILGTLLYTPQFYAKKESYIQIKAQAPGEANSSVEILRKIDRLSPLDGDPENLKEISFQDEICTYEKGWMNEKRLQVNFSIFVDKETFEYKSIREKPKSVKLVSEVTNIFRDLAKQKGATMIAGSWLFESDGNGWVPVNRDGSKILEPELKSLMPPVLPIE